MTKINVTLQPEIIIIDYTMNMKPECSNALVSRAYIEMKDDVMSYFNLYTHDSTKSEDMVQDLFIRLLDYTNIIVEQTVRSLVFTMAKRMMIDDARRQAFIRRATAEYKLKAEDNKFWRESQSIDCRLIEEVERAKLATMPPKMAEVYRMARFEELTADEMTERLQISKRTVEYHLYVSRKEMRQTIQRAIM